MFSQREREDVVLYGIYVYIYIASLFLLVCCLDFCQVFRIQTTN